MNPNWKEQLYSLLDARIFVAALFLATQPLLGQTSASRNLSNCLSGKYPSLCDYSRLTHDQVREAHAAEARENLSICLTGKYPTLCKHSLLTPDQARRVQEAERAENLRTCLTGKYPSLCKTSLLTPVELTRVRRAEKDENLKTCLSGRYLSLCDHTLLTPEQKRTVAAVETSASDARPKIAARNPPRVFASTDCESGHWISSVEDGGRVIRLEDGTYWQVDSLDTITTALWLPISSITLCGSKMINDDESATVQLLSGTGAESGSAPTGSRSYLIEAAIEDETFVINGSAFKAKTYCFGFRKGDRVTFLDGSPFGACASARFLNLRSEKICDVWCD
jgi:hypothetical protein